MKTSTLLVAAACLLAAKLPSSAQTPITVPDYSFDTYSIYFGGSSYTNQQADTPDGYSPFSVTEIFDGWLSGAGNRQFVTIATSGALGSYGGDSSSAYTNGSSDTIESLNPVTTIVADATYTMTISLLSNGYPYQDALLQMLATTQTAPGGDPTVYAYNEPGGTNTQGPATLLSPYPVITTLATLATTDISAGTLSGQPANTFVDYSVTFDTLNGDNAAYIGDGLTLYFADGASQAFDNVRLTEIAPVPEPATWMTLLGGMGILAFWQKNRRFWR